MRRGRTIRSNEGGRKKVLHEGRKEGRKDYIKARKDCMKEGRVDCIKEGGLYEGREEERKEGRKKRKEGRNGGRNKIRNEGTKEQKKEGRNNGTKERPSFSAFWPLNSFAFGLSSP